MQRSFYILHGHLEKQGTGAGLHGQRWDNLVLLEIFVHKHLRGWLVAQVILFTGTQQWTSSLTFCLVLWHSSQHSL